MILKEAAEFVIDPVRTARTAIQDLDNVEKTFIGLKVEHFFRDFVDLPKGARDLSLDGVDIDIKNTVTSTWMIPPETYRQQEPCLLIATERTGASCSLGLMVAREAYLTAPNRDQKRGVSAAGKQQIVWLVKDEPMPPSRWEDIDILRFRELRKIRPGRERAAQFFRENLSKVIHRTILVALLFDQKDPIKRTRGNGGARDLLRPEGIEILSGVYDKRRLKELGMSSIEKDEFIAVRTAGQ